MYFITSDYMQLKIMYTALSLPLCINENKRGGKKIKMQRKFSLKFDETNCCFSLG